MERVLLIEPDKEQSELLAGWLKAEGYRVSLVDKPEEAYGLLSREEFDVLIMDIDPPAPTENMLDLSQKIKNHARFSDLPIAVLTYKKDGKRIASALEAGVDSFVLKPFETDSFLKRIETIFKEIELKKQGKKVLDLNYINYLIGLTSEADREDFFLLSPVIFNRLIMDKVKTILGESVLMVMTKRAQELIGEDYEFMRAVKFQGGEIYLEEVEKVSKGIAVDRLATAFRDYVYGVLHLVGTLTSDVLMERRKLETD